MIYLFKNQPIMKKKYCWVIGKDFKTREVKPFSTKRREAVRDGCKVYDTWAEAQAAIAAGEDGRIKAQP
jgi:site-specific recombinase XerC